MHFLGGPCFVRAYDPFATPQRGSFRQSARLFGIVCCVEHRDDGAPFQCVLPGPSVCVQARSVDVITISCLCCGFIFDPSLMGEMRP